ncbi:MAG TPA: hypothetical protein VEP66_14895 [Myxococcales bacterium]|nr:hypothetical protein [Myxococcales bacterium]
MQLQRLLSCLSLCALAACGGGADRGRSLLSSQTSGSGSGPVYWGYEASPTSTNSRLIAYHAVADNPSFAECVPSGEHLPANSIGRGVAYDPQDANLWISRIDDFFRGDARITKVTPPNVSPGTCPEMESLSVHYLNGDPPEQPGFGALDADSDSKHIWATGFAPVTVAGEMRNYIYLVNRNNGQILQSCYLPALDIFQFNDSLASVRLDGLPGSGKYLLTDNGWFTGTDPLLAIDTSDCHQGRLVTPVAQFPKTRGMTGIDFEGPGLLYVNIFQVFNAGDQPFDESLNVFLGPTGTSFTEDISMCGYRGRFGGKGNDDCPYE